MPAPNFLQSWRKGRSVTPAMGATTRLFLTEMEPICTVVYLLRESCLFYRQMAFYKSEDFKLLMPFIA